MNLVDLHVHSTCSMDGRSSPLTLAHRAAELGLSELGFAEHVDLDPRASDYLYLDRKRYDREIAAARSAVPEVTIRQGVEITYQSLLAVALEEWLAGHPWDFVIASVHVVDYVDGWAVVSEPMGQNGYFCTHTQRQAYRPYFEQVLRAAQSGLGTVLGHLDLVKRYGTAVYGAFDPHFFEEEIRVVLRAAVEYGVGLEINTSGLRQAPGTPYPDQTILRWYREMGGDLLTTGSDAHHCCDLSSGLANAADLARAAGFRAIATFEACQPRWIDL